jgi:hypothetical protein
LPFIFAASAVQDGDTVTLMLFHDAVLMAVEGAGAKLAPVGRMNYLMAIESQDISASTFASIARRDMPWRSSS